MSVEIVAMQLEDESTKDESTMVDVAVDKGEGIKVGKSFEVLVGASDEFIGLAVSEGESRVTNVGSVVGNNFFPPFGKIDGCMDGGVLGME